MTTRYPKKPTPVSLDLSNGEAVTIRPFNSNDYMNIPGLMAATAVVLETQQKLSREAVRAGQKAYAQECERQQITLTDAALLSNEEAAARGLVVKIEPVPLSALVKSCHLELTQIIRAALADKSDEWFDTIGLADLILLAGTIYAVNDMGADPGNVKGGQAPKNQTQEKKQPGSTKRAQKAQAKS